MARHAPPIVLAGVARAVSWTRSRRAGLRPSHQTRYRRDFDWLNIAVRYGPGIEKKGRWLVAIGPSVCTEAKLAGGGPGFAATTRAGADLGGFDPGDRLARPCTDIEVHIARFSEEYLPDIALVRKRLRRSPQQSKTISTDGNLETFGGSDRLRWKQLPTKLKRPARGRPFSKRKA